MGRVALLVGVLCAGCVERAAFRCLDAAECGIGACQPTGFCSFPDVSCEGSGHRYGEYAGELSGACVAPPAAPDAGPDAGPDAFVPPPDAPPPDALICPSRENDMSCSDSVLLGAVDGDSGSPTLQQTGFSEERYRVRVLETDGSGGVVPLTATITLEPPAGVDLDLFVTCPSCGDTPISMPGGIGEVEIIDVTHTDLLIPMEDHFDLFIEIRFVDEIVCGGDWTLTIEGDTNPGSAWSCD
jgi:hypothetical protein